MLKDTLRLIPGYDPFATAGDAWLDEGTAIAAINFFQHHLYHIEGALAGTPFLLEPWQQAVVGNLFGWKRKDAKKRTVRRYRESMLFIPRKNGKTPLAAGIGLYYLFCDPERGQQNYIAASTREQAGLLFRHCKGMVQQNSDLDNRCRIYGGTAPGGQSQSIVRENLGSFLKVISGDSDVGAHGKNLNLGIVDELHEQPNRNLIDTLRTSMASANKTQPLMIYTTTSDFDRDGSICNEIHEYACSVRDGKVNDPRFLPVIYEATEKDDWTSPDVWKRANPNIGISVSEEYLAVESEKAKTNPALQNLFKRLHLNIRTRQDELWLDMTRWRACGGDRLTLPLSLPVYGGLDLASKIDLTALAWVWREDGKVCVKVRVWCPEDRIRSMEVDHHDHRYRQWHEQGWLEATPGNVVDYDFIRAAIRRDSSQTSLQEVGYDPWNATQTAVQLQEQDGIKMIEVRQGFASLNEPSKELERLIESGELRHESNPVLDWMAENVKARCDPSGNIRPVKPEQGSRNKIDGIVAFVMALSRLMKNAEPGSVYDNRDMVTLEW